MAYHFADDAFLPSWGSGMRPRDPVEAHEDFPSGFEDFAPKPSKSGIPPGANMQQMDQLTPYGTMPVNDQITQKFDWTPRGEVFLPKLRKHFRVRVAEKSLFLLWWPAFLGVGIVAAFGLSYWHHPAVAHGVLVLSLFIGVSMLAIGMNGGWTGKGSQTFFVVNGCFIVLVAVVSVCLGVYCFQAYTEPYEIYSGSHNYDMVEPSINPGAHRDAGAIEFVVGSKVDADHSIGIRNGDMYCAAPIMGPDATGYAGFWAVGMNCCGARGNFRCGDVSNQQIRSGLVVLDENYFGVEEIPLYTKAAEEVSAQFSIAMPSKPIFVRWSSDVSSDRDQYFHEALEFVASSAAVLFCFMLVVVTTISFLSTSLDVAFAHHYYSVEVYELNDPEIPRKGKKAKKASDPFLSHP